MKTKVRDHASDAVALGLIPGQGTKITYAMWHKKKKKKKHLVMHSEKAMAPHSSTLAWKIPWNGGAWLAAVHGVAKSRTQLSDFTFTFHFHALEKEMATHSIVLVWRIPGTGEPGGLPSMGSHRAGHN